MFEKNLEIGTLLDFYGDLLSEERRKLLAAYYFDDLSLAEAAEIFSMTRQGVRAALKRGERDLFFYEEKLGLAAAHRARRQELADLLSLAGRLRERCLGTGDPALIASAGELEARLSALAGEKETN